jgi:hypothetical protein
MKTSGIRLRTEKVAARTMPALVMTPPVPRSPARTPRRWPRSPTSVVDAERDQEDEAYQRHRVVHGGEAEHVLEEQAARSQRRQVGQHDGGDQDQRRHQRPQDRGQDDKDHGQHQRHDDQRQGGDCCRSHGVRRGDGSWPSWQP